MGDSGDLGIDYSYSRTIHRNHDLLKSVPSGGRIWRYSHAHDRHNPAESSAYVRGGDNSISAFHVLCSLLEVGWVPDDPKERLDALVRCVARASYTFSIVTHKRAGGRWQEGR